MNSLRRILSATLLASALVMASGCTDWERNTFKTLSAAKAVVDAADADYKSGTIPQNQCSQVVINDGKAAQIAAVYAMADYENVKKAKGNVTAQEAEVVADLATLAPLVVRIQSLISYPSTCGVAK